jgi:FkbM family methyltransferase
MKRTHSGTSADSVYLPRRLQIGGGTQIEGWELLSSLAGNDAIGADHLSRYEDDSFDEIHATHVFEQVDPTDLPAAMAGCLRLLKTGGTLEVETSDLEALAAGILDQQTSFDERHAASSILYGCDGLDHRNRSCLTEETLTQLLAGAGFCEITKMATPGMPHPVDAKPDDKRPYKLQMRASKPPFHNAEISDSPMTVRSWALKTHDGLTLHAPDRLASITTFALLEQEQWFEPEIGFVNRLLQPHMNALDIGANHGVYSLALARHLVHGHVWAFEPTSEPRARLRRSVAANGLETRLTVMPIGLSDRKREEEFSVSSNSELNSLHASSESHETVLLDTLDAFASSHLGARKVDFVKLDAEGEEPHVVAGGRRFFETQSPVVMFELKHGSHVNLGLVELFRGYGFEIFRLLPELSVLVPLVLPIDPSDPVLNLFAVKPDQQARLATAQLLVREDDIARQSATFDADPAALSVYEGRLRHSIEFPPIQPGDDPYPEAFANVVAAHFSRSASAAERVRRMMHARDSLSSHVESGQTVSREALLLLVHTLHALGQQLLAVGHARRVVQYWSDEYRPQLPVMTPLARDVERTRTTPLGSWIRQLLLEFIETRRHYSSYYAPCDMDVLVHLLAHPDHSAEMDRRYALHLLREGLNPDLVLAPDYWRLREFQCGDVCDTVIFPCRNGRPYWRTQSWKRNFVSVLESV